MKRKRREVGKEKKFVILSFVVEESDREGLNDDVVKAAMEEEKLRPVTHKEFWAFIDETLPGKRKPKKCVVAFGNLDRGPSESGSFVGVPYLDTDKHVLVQENWMRGHTGKQWDDDWEFVFVSK
jgi:hypothetical protein